MIYFFSLVIKNLFSRFKVSPHFFDKAFCLRLILQDAKRGDLKAEPKGMQINYIYSFTDSTSMFLLRKSWTNANPSRRLSRANILDERIECFIGGRYIIIGIWFG